jgi:hypothetical protein
VKYNQPFDQPSNPNAPYIDGNPSAGIQGSIVPAASIEFDQREIVNVIAAAALSPTNADVTQLLQSLKQIDVNNIFKASTNLGNASQWSASVPQLPIMPPPRGCAIWFKPGFDSVKGGTVFSVNGSAFVNVTHSNLAPIDIGDVVAAQWVLLFFDGTQWQMVTGGTQRTGQIPLLQKNADWYVNPSTGNDTTYDGTSATIISATIGPFQTIQRAIQETQKYNMNGYSQKIHCADGTYQPFVAGITNGVGTVYIEGNISNPQNCVITTASNNQCCGFFNGGVWAMGGFRLQTTAPGLDCLATNLTGTTLTVYGSMRFGTAGRAHLSSGWISIVWIADSTQIYIESGGNAQFHFLATYANMLVGNLNTSIHPYITFLGPVSFSSAFAYPNNAGMTAVYYSSFTNPGNVTGQRYLATMNGVCNVNQQGPNYYPGTIAGVTNTGGQYG